jgi:hypothetical protein
MYTLSTLFNLLHFKPHSGANGLAGASDFKVPVAAFEDREGTFEMVYKFAGKLFSALKVHLIVVFCLFLFYLRDRVKKCTLNPLCTFFMRRAEKRKKQCKSYFLAALALQHGGVARQLLSLQVQPGRLRRRK